MARCFKYLRLCDAIAELFQPLVEVVVHDLISKKIFYIKGGLSLRKVGDPSLIDEDLDLTNLDTLFYSKINFDTRLIRSVSIPFEDNWILCINVDVSVFDKLQAISSLFLGYSHNQPMQLFGVDWQESLHQAINGFLRENKWQFDQMNQSQKKVLVKHLYDIGAFNEKNAADYVAQALNLSRATVFNYLREWRKI